MFPDGRRVVSGAYGELIVWDLETFDPLATLKVRSGFDYDRMGAVYGVAISPDGRRVVSASGDETLKVWGLPESCVAATASSAGRNSM